MKEILDPGACPPGTGLSPSVEPVPVSPPDGASIPSAWRRIPQPEEGETLRLDIIERHKAFGLYWSISDEQWWLDGGWIATRYSYAAIRALRDEVGLWLGTRAAQGIEARRAATGTGAVHESPVGRKADAPEHIGEPRSPSHKDTGHE